MNQADILHQQYLVPTYPFRGLTLVRGKSIYLYDDRGNKYLDFMSNYGVTIFGYGNLHILQALTRQLSMLPTLHGSFANDTRSAASARLVQACGKGFSHVYWGNSGTEAMEAAIKFSLVASGKSHFIAMQGGYHGKTLGSLAMTHSPKYRLPFKSVLPSTTFVSYGDIKSLKEAVTPNTAAIILEPIQGENGIILPPKGYLKEVEAFCQKSNIIFILDEIQTGVGRTGTFLAGHQDALEPDIVCLGKGLAGGIPVGAAVVVPRIAAKISQGVHTSTFGGNPLACAGVLAVLDLSKPDLFSHVREIGEYFLKKLRAIRSPRIKDVRGKGLMVGVELTVLVTPVLKAMQKRGVLAIPAGNTVVRFLPPYTIETSHIDQAVLVFGESLEEIHV